MSILSWNVMHPDFALCHINTTFTHATEDELIWTNRLPKLRQKIAATNADIVCLQEVSQESFVSDFGTYFQDKHGYNYRLNDSRGRVEAGKGEGDFTTAILFKSNKFECVHQDNRSRATIVLLTNKLEQSQCAHCTHSQRICLYHSMFVVNVHLEVAKNQDKSGVNALKKVLKRIDWCISDKLRLNADAESANIRILILGDFNCSIKDEGSRMLLNANGDSKKHRYRFQEAIQQQMLSANYHCDHDDEDLHYNLRIKHFPSYITNGRAYSIDLLFYTVNSLRLKGVGNQLDDHLESEVKWKEQCTQRIDQWLENGRNTNQHGVDYCADYTDIVALPNEHFPSDHLPMSGLFEFENVCGALNGGNQQCRCCLEQKVKRKLSKKEKKEQRKRRREQQLNKGRKKNKEENLERRRQREAEMQRRERFKYVLLATWFAFGCKLVANRMRL